jgi:hypothetical protein
MRDGFGGVIWLDKYAIHQSLINRCLEIMGGHLAKNICLLPDVSSQLSDLNPTSIDAHLTPELQYACRYWSQHLVQSHIPVNEAEKAFFLLRMHLLHWIEVMSLLGLVTEALEAISRTQSIIQVSIRELHSQILIEK